MNQPRPQPRPPTSTFDLQALAAKFPPTAKPMLLDIRRTDEPSAARAFCASTGLGLRTTTRHAMSICR